MFWRTNSDLTLSKATDLSKKSFFRRVFTLSAKVTCHFDRSQWDFQLKTIVLDISITKWMGFQNASVKLGNALINIAGWEMVSGWDKRCHDVLIEGIVTWSVVRFPHGTVLECTDSERIKRWESFCTYDRLHNYLFKIECMIYLLKFSVCWKKYSWQAFYEIRGNHS